MDLAAISSICVFGDSIVYAHTDPGRGGWPGRLRAAVTEAKEDGAVYALGIPGNRVQDVCNRFDAEAAARRPELVIVAVGTADSPNTYSQPTPLHVFEQQYRQLLTQIRAGGAAAIVVTPPNIDETRPTYGFTNKMLEPYVRAISAACRSAGVAYVEAFGSLSAEDFDRDGIHPEASGHDKIFVTLMSGLDAIENLGS